MRNRLMIGLWRYMLGVPPFMWEKQIEKVEQKAKRSRGFMTPEHRLVHHFVVREMPRLGGPVPQELVSRELALPPERVSDIVRDLESRLTFLYTNDDAQVTWAYPVTVEKTDHSITFHSAERLYAA
jgi:hypothetical protein